MKSKKTVPESRALSLLCQAHIWRRGGVRISSNMTSSLGRSAPNEACPVSRDQASAAGRAIRPDEETKIEAEAKSEAKTDDRVRVRRLEAAKRALSEAEGRRAAARIAESKVEEPQKGERNGRGGLDPVRYGDWEVKGIATDF